MIKVLTLLLCTSVLGYERCNRQSALSQVRTPTYDFSVRILDRVAQETNGHFVFSPISTWLQLLALADGARSTTLKEILEVTRYHRIPCFRRKFREIINDLGRELSDVAQHRSVIAVNRLLDVKHSYVTAVEKLNGTKVISTNFKNNIQAAIEANEFLKLDANGLVNNWIDEDDFDMSFLLLIDVANLVADWRSPFNREFTKIQRFYTDEKVPDGNVNMMEQTAYFNYTDVPSINARALELPFNERLSMIFLLPNKGKATNLFWLMKNVNLKAIFSSFSTNGEKLVNVQLPRFKITTDIENVPELVHDMGVHRIFYPHLADLKALSDYKVSVSMMENVANIEVTEIGVKANINPQFLINRNKSEGVQFILNKPFAYLIVDKVTELILFAGVYTNPSVY